MIDKGGVTSDEAVATIEANSSTHTVTFKVVDEEGGTLTANYGSNPWTNATSTVQVPNGTTVTFTATPDPGWELDSWTGVTSSSSLNATLTVDGDTTVTVKFKRVTTIQNGNSFAWKLLKDAVKVAVDGTTITIKGEIKASVSYEGGWGQIVINENLTIKGETGAGTDILDANTMSRIFKVASGKTLTLKNLTLKGGKPNETEDADKCGGAIFARDATVNIENCIITGNEAATNGGGIYVESTYTKITNCIFTKNTARDGGGIYINKTGGHIYVVEIIDGTIGGTGQANKATRNGGGIYVGQSCILNLKDSTDSGTQGVLIKGNDAVKGGGVYAANNATVSMQGGTRIDEYNKNDVYLDSRSAISVGNALTAASPVARITVPGENYLTSTQVLYGDAVGSQHSKFIVTPKGNQQWKVNSYGHLQPK